MSVDAIGRNNVRVVGHGHRPMVFGHGLGTDQRAWRLVTPAFQSTHRLVLFDHVGCGDADRNAYADARHGSLEGYACDLLDLLDALRLDDVVYVGHSVGGVIGLLASLQQPQRFARLVLIGTSPCFLNDPPYYRGGFEPGDIEAIFDSMELDDVAWTDARARMVLGDEAPDAVVRDYGAGLRVQDPLVARRFGRLAFMADVRDRLDRVTVPSFVLGCSRDSVVPAEVSRYLHRHLTDSTLGEIDGSGHCPHLSHPQQTASLIAQYLQARDGRG